MKFCENNIREHELQGCNCNQQEQRLQGARFMAMKKRKCGNTEMDLGKPKSGAPNDYNILKYDDQVKADDLKPFAQRYFLIT